MLDEKSRNFTTINTHKGLFRYNRLYYGLKSAPGIFQRTMENILQGIWNFIIRIDDILLTGTTRRKHFETLEEVLNRLEKFGIRLKREKCKFLVPEILYLGHVVNREGIKPSEGKVKSIRRPTSVKNLQAFLAMINYYAQYIPNISIILAPLHQLLKKEAKWEWTSKQEQAWEEAKEQLNSPKVLVHFDPSKAVTVACDDSPYGVGAVLSHIMEDGSERQIAFVSRTLAPAEKNYSQIDKESLAVVSGVKKFHQYLYGRLFKLYTDYKPLLGYFKENKKIPEISSARIQRWAVILSTHAYQLEYREGRKNGNADGLSRLPRPTKLKVPIYEENIMLLEYLDQTPVTYQEIARWTKKDKLLKQVINYVNNGWPDKCPTTEEWRPYFNKRHEIGIVEECLLWGRRVIVSIRGRKKLMEALHEGHPGIVRIKGLTRTCFWRPKLDQEIEFKVRNCYECQQTNQMPATAPLHPWEIPEEEWSRLHIDYAGPFKGHLFLVIVDAFSKWLDVYVSNSATTGTTLENQQRCFAIHGLPKKIVTDNAAVL